MNEVASPHYFEAAMWVIGSLFTVLTLLIGAIYRSHREELKWLRENCVTKETLERVERTFRDAVDDMVKQRIVNHAENRDAMREIKESVNGIHRRIDEEFRYFRNTPKG